MIEFHGQVIDGRLVFPPMQEQLRCDWLKSSGGKYVVEKLYRRGTLRTSNQIKTHFGLAVEMIRQKMIELGWSICGVSPNKQMVHEILTKTCMGVGDMGDTIRLSEQTIEQNMQTFENIRDWSATQLNLCIPDPDPAWKERP